MVEHSPLKPPPLALYVHLPWCVRKCPYCDFNSHERKGDIPDAAYIDALIADLQNDLPLVWGRPVSSIYFGGGTPSLFSAAQIECLLERIRALVQVAPNAEITLEANPGTVEHDSFAAYRAAGVNRVSLGAQSFDDRLLKAIGRIHGSAEIQGAVSSLKSGGPGNFNIDLMFGLPGQTVEGAVSDIRRAIECGPAHISHYQLTIEPNTQFASQPPKLPDPELCWDMQESCASLLDEAGFHQYEISAWSRPGSECRHNLNYWRFGDYLGIGAGAHGKITVASENRILRIAKQRHPRRYLAALEDSEWRFETRELDTDHRIFEYFLNHLRLKQDVLWEHFSNRTGLSPDLLESPLEIARQKSLIELYDVGVRQTQTGWRFNNDLQAIFLPPAADEEGLAINHAGQ